jgi:hypothetical protein
MDKTINLIIYEGSIGLFSMKYLFVIIVFLAYYMSLEFTIRNRTYNT